MGQNEVAIKGFGSDIVAELSASAVITPPSYSVENALKSAYLALQETEGKQGLALKVCTPVSIRNALLDMAVQGLNPAKKQCYFVVYGNKLQLIRSYMGSKMLAKRVDPRIADIRARCIYDGDELTYEIVNGLKVIGPHKQQFGNINKDKIVGAYVLAVDEDEKILASEIMTIADIKQSWRQSKMKDVVSASGTVNKEKVHGKFTGEMAKKTVINRLCKQIISASDDEMLMRSIYQTPDEVTEKDPLDVEVAENANATLIDFPAEQGGQAAAKLPTVEGEAVAMASEAQAKQIVALEKELGTEQNAVLDNLSSFVDRQVNRLRELTETEAAKYIAHLQALPHKKTKPKWA